MPTVPRPLPALAGLLEAPLRELFWSPPETSMVEEATHRIAAPCTVGQKTHRIHNVRP